ncbi:hypothetical protein [Arthrobacter sp. B2a2-09]|uniref:hypothetical protein n=1 Tax=Arthrobacter sp. B2a2-09 TaxID=2952822 RepID=UPI0022CDB220|nr:hypothetical protein [Arthrobacter sp. B2a2-09]MCZ9880685.1 hypothetical protein [Arthrobacter sp. B2a2-09]
MVRIEELTDTDSGTFAFRTSTGSLYRIALGNSPSLTRLPADQDPEAAYRTAGVSVLRMDTQEIPLLGIGKLKVGERAVLFLDIVGDGLTVTARDTSEVVSIHLLKSHGPI